MSDSATKSPPQSPRPKIPIVPPPEKPVGGGKQALLIAIALIIVAIITHQGKCSFVSYHSPMGVRTLWHIQLWFTATVLQRYACLFLIHKFAVAALLMFTGGVSPHSQEVMQTFAMIKPDCADKREEIIERIKVCSCD